MKTSVGFTADFRAEQTVARARTHSRSHPRERAQVETAFYRSAWIVFFSPRTPAGRRGTGGLPVEE